MASESCARRLACFVVLALGVASPLLCPTVTPAQTGAPPTPAVTFAHITDAHIFDDGWQRPTAVAMRQAADDRTALEWAVGKITALVASGVTIDFVVYTGDLGLQNVDFPRRQDCQVAAAKPEPGVPLVPLAWAVAEVADTLKKLAVRRVFFVAGNNDAIGERVTDAPRHDCFVAELRGALRSSSLEVSTLDTAGVDVNGIRVVGLNSASFKAAKNYSEPCASRPPSSSDARTLARACPAPQMDALRALGDQRLVLFTHVPDLRDPYRKHPSWEIEPSVRALWEAEVCRPRVLGVFAGHFHDSDRNLYGSTGGVKALAITPCVADKTWVAPPLAIKNQTDKEHPARGFLVVTVTSGRPLPPTVHWFTPESPDPLARLTSRFGPWGWPVAAAAVFVLAAVGLAVTIRSRDDAHRDFRAVCATALFVDLALVAVWLVRRQLEITDSPTLIALLVLPLVLYGIVSGRLTEFSGPGGWGAKFREAARQAVAPVPLDVQQPTTVMKGGAEELRQNLAAGRIREGSPLVLKLVVASGRAYDAPTLRTYLDALATFADFKLAIFVDAQDRLVGYTTPRALQRPSAATPTVLDELLAAVNRGDVVTVRSLPGVITEAISRRTTNAQALATMDRLSVNTLVVTDEATGTVIGIVDREHTLARMVAALG